MVYCNIAGHYVLLFHWLVSGLDLYTIENRKAMIAIIDIKNHNRIVLIVLPVDKVIGHRLINFIFVLFMVVSSLSYVSFTILRWYKLQKISSLMVFVQYVLAS